MYTGQINERKNTKRIERGLQLVTINCFQRERRLH